jgi:Ca2+-binding RTX toxin-like protein
MDAALIPRKEEPMSATAAATVTTKLNEPVALGWKRRRRRGWFYRFWASADGLECRRLLAPLVENGTSGNDSIDVSYFSGTTYLRVTKNGSTTDYLASSYDGIQLNGLAGNDTLSVSVFISLPATLSGGDGSDTIIGGGGNDSLAGGAGHDTYRYSGSSDLGSDTIDEGATADADTLDFESLGGRLHGNEVGFSLRNTTTQIAADNLVLTLSTDTGIEKVIGTPHNDLVLGNTRANTLEGRGGDDHMTGWDGSDTLYGGDGDDCIHGEAGTDLEYGGAGNDDIGDQGSEPLNAGPDTENDTMYGNTGDDDIFLGDGDDFGYGHDGPIGPLASLYGGGADYIEGNAGADWVYGGGGNDIILGGDGIDRLYGDYLSVASPGTYLDEGDDTIDGEGDGDWLYGDSYGVASGWGYGNDVLNGGAGDDTVFGESGYGNGSLVEGNDTLYGSLGSDTLSGEDGSDTYRFATASDSEDLGAERVVDTGGIGALGADTLDFLPFLFPAPPPNTGITVTLASTSGQTVVSNRLTLTMPTLNSIENVFGSSRYDSITGNGLDNVLRGNAGNDTINGGGGTDTADYSSSNDPVNISLDGTINDSDGFNSTDVLGTDLENITGGQGADTLSGGPSTNTTANVLKGGPGNDTIYGGGGNDTLWGEGGQDDLYGEDGNDLFKAKGDGVIDNLFGGGGTDTARLSTDRDLDDVLNGIENT